MSNIGVVSKPIFRLVKLVLLIGCVISFKVYGTDVLMWQLPSTGIQYPVYVYQGGKQIDYLYGPTQQAIVGDYSSTTNGTYELYYGVTNKPDPKRAIVVQPLFDWYSCKLVITAGAIDQATTCSGAVINKPAVNGSATSNVYTVTMGANPWPATVLPPASPTKTNYGQREITFKNNTGYHMIRIGQVCTLSDNPNNKNKCKTTQNLFEINKGDSATFKVDDESAEGKNFPAGLNSYGFTITAYQVSKSGSVIETGGYGAGQQPYATKIEFTSKAVDTVDGHQVPTGATNFDISAVDGFNISAKGYPSVATYCTYTVPPENSNLLGASLYSKSVPLAQISAGQTLCAASSQLPSGSSGKKWDLQAIDGAGDYQGCMSPCSYAKTKNSSDKDLFCCFGSYDTPGTCDQAAGVKGANNSSYVTNLVAPASNHVYRFAYDDAIGDFACPAETDFIIEFSST